MSTLSTVGSERRIVLAGGTGFIGGALERYYKKLGYQVAMISRHDGHIAWNDRAGIVEALDGAEMLVNLAGRSVNCRYNERNRRQIMDSRTQTTTILGRVFKPRRKQIWLNFRSMQGTFPKACRGTSRERDAAAGEKAAKDALQ
uniref:NAD-dependent epimerase/dehydratase family protein n=1 Tax=Saccharibacillus sp. CPCC 101409 TaxID=3058041 RepID=UPI0034A015F9